MTKIVYSDPLYPRFLRTSVHLPVEIAFRDGEHPVILTDVILHFQVVLDLISQKLRHGDGSVTLFGLGRGDHILAFQSLIALVDGHCTFLKIEICRGQCQLLCRDFTADCNTEQRG